MQFETNKKIGKLTLLARLQTTSETGRKRVHWKCRCDCGNVQNIRQDNISMGLSRSCGCTRAAQKSRDIGVALSSCGGRS